MSARLRHALAAGLRATAVVAFANAATVLVVAASLPEVNHVHDEGTPEHVHALGEVFGAASTAVPHVVVAHADTVARGAVGHGVDGVERPSAWSDRGARDPPAGRRDRTHVDRPTPSHTHHSASHRAARLARAGQPPERSACLHRTAPSTTARSTAPPPRSIPRAAASSAASAAAWAR